MATATTNELDALIHRRKAALIVSLAYDIASKPGAVGRHDLKQKSSRDGIILAVERVLHRKGVKLAEISREEVHEQLLSLTPDEDALWKANPSVVRSALVHKPFSLTYDLLIPSAGDEPLLLHEYFDNWLHFVARALLDDNYANERLMLSLDAAVTKLQHANAYRILHELWCDRWLCNSLFVGDLIDHYTSSVRTFIMRFLGRDKERSKHLSDLTDELRKAKLESRTLDEWLESLYCLLPCVSYLRSCFQYDYSKDGRKWLRWLDEVEADIISLISSCGQQWLWEDESAVLHSLFLSDAAFPDVRDKDYKTLKRHLSHLYSGRVQIPRFWYEQALKHLKNTKKNIVLRDNLDPLHFLPIVLMAFPDHRKVNFSAKSYEEIKLRATRYMPYVKFIENSELPHGVKGKFKP